MFPGFPNNRFFKFILNSSCVMIFGVVTIKSQPVEIFDELKNGTMELDLEQNAKLSPKIHQNKTIWLNPLF